MKVNTLQFIFMLACTLFTACNNQPADSKDATMNEIDTIQIELKKTDSLLHDKGFAKTMAQALEADYYDAAGEPTPAFLQPGEDSVKVEKTVKEEKIAINVAGFYALECGINYLCSSNNSTPAEWIDKITTQKIDSNQLEILNRFANATWKAGQPFRGLNRISKDNFISWSGLNDAEVKKDYRQIVGAAQKLRSNLSGNKTDQFIQLKKLLQSSEFALEMASFLDSNYYIGENKTAPAFISKEEETAVTHKSFEEMKIATNIAGFYAVECGVNYLVATKKQKPSSILQTIIDSSISNADKLLLCRFANATWKAGQPFRGLNRIARETFTPFNFLSEADVEKDWVQIKAAAKLWLHALAL